MPDDILGSLTGILWHIIRDPIRRERHDLHAERSAASFSIFSHPTRIRNARVMALATRASRGRFLEFG